MAAGVTQPGGAGTTIYIFDNASAADGTAYHFAEISAAFPVDFIDNGTTPKTYRSKVSLQVGDTTTTAAATTLSDTDVGVYFDAGKTLQYRTAQQSSWKTQFGTKIGTGNKASGRNGCTICCGAVTPTTFRGNILWYGSTIITKGNFILQPGYAGAPGDIQGCVLGINNTGNFQFLLGAAGAGNQFGNIFNTTLWANQSVANQGILGNSSFATAEDVKIGGPSMSYIMKVTSTGTLTIKDMSLVGTPTTGDMSYTPGGAANWDLVRPIWSGNAPRFGTILAAAGLIREDWLWNLRVVDRAGAAIASIPVMLTDTLGNVQVNTTTDANGQVSFGSGLLLNAVTVRDHYGDAVTYSTRERSPFTVAINTGASANSSYLSRTYKFSWPLTETGVFQDVNDVVAIQDQSGNPTTWIEASIT